MLETYRGDAYFGKRLDLITSDLFSELPSEEGVGGGDAEFFDGVFGRFQLAMQATTE